MTQEKVGDACARAAEIAMDPLLDGSGWASLKEAMAELHSSLEKAGIDLARRASSQLSRHRNAGAEERGSFFTSGGSNESVQYVDPTAMVNVKYAALDAAVAASNLYLPVPISPFEPTSEAERYHFLRHLRLSVPIVIAKFVVGSSIGNMTFVIQRRAGDSVEEDRDEVEEGRSAAATLLPKFHSRAVVNLFTKRSKQLGVLQPMIARALFWELTGTDTRPTSQNQAQIDAYVEHFLAVIGDPEVVLDLRAIANGHRNGISTFMSFWGCVDAYLVKLNTAAQERRHGGVVCFLSDVLSFPVMYRELVEMFDEKKSSGRIGADERAPSLRWLMLNFWPSNEHVRAAECYTGRFPLCCMLQTRSLRKGHAHVKYCLLQKSQAQV